MTRVTVGVPTYNRAAYLPKALANILAQSYTDFEMVVSDDASPDDTAKVVASIDDPRVRYSRNAANLRIPGNLNRLLDLSRGEYIVFLHDHDIFDVRLLERMVAYLDGHPSVGFVHTGIAFIDDDGSNYQDVSPSLPKLCAGRELARTILLGDSFACPVSACGMVRRSAYEAVGFSYDSEFGFLSDIDMWLRLALKFDVGFIAEPLITCRRREADHEYGGINWQLTRWISEIHRINIGRFYGDDEAALSQALATWRRKLRAHIRQTLLTALLHGDGGAVKEGLDVANSVELGLLGHLARTSLAFPSLVRLFSKVSVAASQGRKRLRAVMPAK